MENHPIPQDVTGFQFKLIGNMTIKQFAFLSTGVVFAWVIYLSPLPGFIKLPISMLLFFFGFSLAFIPIEGRPMDVIILHFIKALFTPNQYIFQRGNTQFTHMRHIPAPTNVPVTQMPQTPPITAPNVAPEPEKNEELKQEPQPTTQNVQYQILQQDLQVALNEKVKIEKELLELKQMLTQQRETIVPSPPPTQPPQKTNVTAPIVKTVEPKSAPKTTSFPISEAPNVLIGIIRDARENILPNILVEVKDKDGNPVRAFKTNQLGQFASATPLVNGVYALTFEDPENKQKFNALELTMVGEIIGPIEIASIDTREELRKALFS